MSFVHAGYGVYEKAMEFTKKLRLLAARQSDELGRATGAVCAVGEM